MVICCIGTPKIIGDSVAPKVADILIKRNIPAYIYGTTARPITALNYADYASYIKTRHRGELIIAIDCALGKRENIGRIKLSKKGIAPGRAVGKELERIGDIGILGQVGDIDKDAISELKSTPPHIINSLIENICNIVIDISDCVSIALLNKI